MLEIIVYKWIKTVSNNIINHKVCNKYKMKSKDLFLKKMNSNYNNQSNKRL